MNDLASVVEYLEGLRARLPDDRTCAERGSIFRQGCSECDRYSEREPWKARQELERLAPQLLDALIQTAKALDFGETLMSPNMTDHRCAEFGDWGEPRDSVQPDKRCGECTGCARFGFWQMARQALTALHALRKDGK